MTQIRRFNQLLSAFILLAATAWSASPGKPTPAFELKDLSGKPVALSAQKGQVVFLNFWASWCAPCKVEFPHLNDLAAAYEGRGVRVIAVNLDRDPANATKFLEKGIKGALKLTVLRDPEMKTAEAYEVEAMPSSFIIDANGVIRHAHLGYQPGDEKKWRREIDALLGGE